MCYNHVDYEFLFALLRNIHRVEEKGVQIINVRSNLLTSNKIFMVYIDFFFLITLVSQKYAIRSTFFAGTRVDSKKVSL